MNGSTCRNCLALGLIFANACAITLAEEKKIGLIVYQDDFSDVQGFVSSNVSGKYIDGDPKRTREAHSYMGDSRYGNMTMVVHEDDQAKGHDGKPGLLAFAIDETPTRVAYSGFAYAGRVDNALRIKCLNDRPNAQTLERLRLSYRHRSTNPHRGRSGASYDFRLELEIDDSYETRLDLGTLRSYVSWQKFDSSLRIGRNQAAFLQAIKDNPGVPVKLIWSQKGDISNYDDGDTLLIDDIQLILSP